MPRKGRFSTIPNTTGIYSITCTGNGRVYVGQALAVRRRLYQHLRNLRAEKSNNIYLQRAWKKYGEDAFRFSVLEVCGPDDLDERELFWISKLQAKSKASGFNIANGGEGGSRGIKHRPESIRRMVEGRREKGSLRLLTANGQTKSLAEWAREVGVGITTLHSRLSALTLEEALIAKVNYDDPRHIAFGQSGTLKELCLKFGIKKTTVKYRMSRGKTLEEALTEPKIGEQYVLKGVSKTLKDWAAEYSLEYATVRHRLYRGWALEKALTTPVRPKCVA